ncbi:MAG: hypothetical protein IPK21_04675 [Haliscomenobacter sp.]|nr:hypothetical protein [Haliscomenobacter sp.]
MKSMSLITMLSLLTTFAMAQPVDIKELINTRIAARNFNFPDSILSNREFQQRIIPELEKANKDILANPHDICDSYYWALTDLYRQNPEPEIRGKLAELMLYGCLDQSEWLRLNNMHFLVRLARPADFNAQRLEMLKALILHPTLHTTPLFPLVGKLDWPEGERLMRRFFEQGPELLPDDADRPGGYRASPNGGLLWRWPKKAIRQPWTISFKKPGRKKTATSCIACCSTTLPSSAPAAASTFSSNMCTAI